MSQHLKNKASAPSSVGGEDQPLLAKSDQSLSTPTPDDDMSPWTDVKDTIQLALPMCLAMLSWVGMKMTDTALLGHVSPQALAAASLSDLFTMCSLVLIQGRVLGVLTGGAIGAGNPKLAGIFLQISLVVLALVAVFVMVCWWFTGVIWNKLGSDAEVASMAGYYARVLSLSIPAQVCFGQLSQFFSSQRILHPEVNSSTIALVLNLFFGLILVLGIPLPHFEGFGFPVCPMVTTFVVYIQVGVLVGFYCGVQKLHAPCWPGWQPAEWTWGRIKIFCQLYVPAALGMASDFWRVAVVGMAAARLGETEVSVFNSAYRLMWIVLICISSLASAAGIKMTLRLGRNQGKLARQAGLIGLGLAAVVLFVLFFGVLFNLRALGRIFTDDPQFLDLLEEAGLPFSLTLALMNFSVALERLPYAMGRTQEVFWYGFIASWGFQVPAVYLLTTSNSPLFWRDDLVGLYTGMAIGYGALTCLYGWIVASSDWDRQAALSVSRAEMPPKLGFGEKEGV